MNHHRRWFAYSYSCACFWNILMLDSFLAFLQAIFYDFYARGGRAALRAYALTSRAH